MEIVGLSIGLLLGALCALVAFGSVLVLGGIFALVVVQTIQRKGRWGMNFQVPPCPGCGAKAPTFRKPANARQAMWGGWTCEDCGTESDKWGVVVP